MYYSRKQVTLLKDTQKLVDIAGTIDYSNIDILMSKENVFAWHRRINFFYKVTKEVENYLLYSSLPYCIGLGTKTSMLDIWPSYPFPSPDGTTKHMGDMSVLPTGNIRPTYMVVGDTPNSSPRHNKRMFDKTTKQQGFFDRAWTRGFAARVMRGAMDELQIHRETWYTNIMKLTTNYHHKLTLEECKAHYPLLVNEIDILKPEILILVGKNAAKYAPKLGLVHLCNERGIKIVRAKHPSLFKDTHCKIDAHKKYANHLFDILF